MQRQFAVFMALIALVAGSMFTGMVTAADNNPCANSASYSAAAVVQNTVWRMQVSEDESAYRGPSIHDRLNHNWNQTAKRTYRWTSIAAPVDAGTSTKLMTVSAAVIAESVPALEKGDIVDVEVVQGIDYSQGRAPVVVRRACAARDEGCLGELRKTQGGKVSGLTVRGGYQVACYRKLSPPLANLGCALQKGCCRGEVAAVSR
jgi:hypothetical protein